MNQTKVTSLLDTALQAVILATVFMYPLIFNPWSASMFELNKTIFLLLMTGILISVQMIRNMVNKSFHLTLTGFGVSYMVLMLLVVIRSLSTSLPRTIENLLSGGLLALCLLLFFLIASSITQKSTLVIRTTMALVSSAVVLSLLSIIETAQIGPSAWLRAMGQPVANETFITPAGSAVLLLSFLLPILILTLTQAVIKKDVGLKSFYFGSAAVITASLVIAIFTILPGRPNAPVFLPFSNSWIIAVENIKSPTNLIIGVGSNNYLKAFSLHRGVSFNQLEQWNTRFTSARNYPLHVFTTLGLVGLIALMSLVYYLAKLVYQASQLTWLSRSFLLSFATLFLIILIIPNNFLLQFLIGVLLLLLTWELKVQKSPFVSELLLKLFAAKLVDTQHVPDFQQSHRTEVLPILLGVPLILLTLFSWYGSYRVLAADMIYKSSLVAANENDGTKTYDLQRDAIAQNPYLSLYHRTYASTNLALATSLSAKPDITESDQQTVSTLVRQAIREGQNAVRINPDNPANWETLATIYRNLLTLAEGADQWTLTSLSQAITLDPISPRLWLEAGSVFYRLERFPDAISAFQRSVQLKPDWANAHYNLANAYRLNKENDRAVASYEAALRLLDSGSADYSKAKAELDQLKTELGLTPEQAERVNTSLTNPGDDSLNLPADAQLDLSSEDAPPADNNGFGDVLEASPSGEASGSGEVVN